MKINTLKEFIDHVTNDLQLDVWYTKEAENEFIATLNTKPVGPIPGHLQLTETCMSKRIITPLIRYDR